MSKGCWNVDEEDKDLDEEDTEEDELCKEYSSWDRIPDILLEEIFSYLSIRERYYASLVCRAWYRAFELRNVWSTFTLEDATLTRGKFNYYSGWQYVLDHIRTSTCLNKVGRNFRALVFEPMLNFYNLYEFMNMISWYAERQGSDDASVAGVGTYIRRLKFTFPCNMANGDDPDRIRVFGTGGKLLEALKRLMRNLRNLKCLELIDLMLESNEALHLMDDICTNCTQTLSKLILINATRYYCPLLHVGVFVNLNVSPSMVFHGTFFESTIRVYAFKGVTRYYLHRSFAKRLDEPLVQFCRMCPNLHTLMIRDKISTATILEIVSTAKCLRCLYVRRNVVLKRFDRAWSEALDSSSEYYRWIKVNSRSYENTEREVSRILGYRWHMLSEKEFKTQIVTLHI
ncbi:uncharacterized protein LOC143905544 isoform X3 [Temnothorax americanus]|uniref:uncharacterized protein LOC143905544 isoform X3 n=1 Tax=Temnothorax americanus TaxID=1964332 RepID=UPI0040699183